MEEKTVNAEPQINVEDVVKRIENLQKLRATLKSLNEELLVKDSDLARIETVYGTNSTEFGVAKELFDDTTKRIEDTKNDIEKLSFKQSELKPYLDELTKKFEDTYKAETSKEYHIEMTAEKEGDSVNTSKGKKVFKQLLDYLYHNVTFTPKNAINLWVLVRNMEENKPWVNSKEFDGVIILRSASVLNLWRFIMEEMNGKGFYEARTFLECWANCGQSISDAVREIQKDNEISRKVGADLNLVESEFDISENDIPQDSVKVTTKEEVDPEVNEIV